MACQAVESWQDGHVEFYSGSVFAVLWNETAISCPFFPAIVAEEWSAKKFLQTSRQTGFD